MESMKRVTSKSARRTASDPTAEEGEQPEKAPEKPKPKIKVRQEGKVNGQLSSGRETDPIPGTISKAERQMEGGGAGSVLCFPPSARPLALGTTGDRSDTVSQRGDHESNQKPLPGTWVAS